jgi:ubiquinone/menaquinone biosynthesis C-methylase UbiE
MRELPFADERFEVVVSTASIHHWKDPDRGLAEIYRVLKPGGTLSSRTW